MQETSVNLITVILATIIQVSLGMVWFGPYIFGNFWAKIMGTDMDKFRKMSIEEKEKFNKEMLPIYISQTAATFIATIILSMCIKMFPQVNPYTVAVFTWFGFVFTSHITTTVWSATKIKYMSSQIAISSSFQLISMLLVAFLTTLFG